MNNLTIDPTLTMLLNTLCTIKSTTNYSLIEKKSSLAILKNSKDFF